jgi:hypothetical protein
LAFFKNFCIFLCRAYFWVTHGKERVTPSPRGRPSTPSLCRVSHIAHDKELCRVLHFPKAHGKGLYRAKMRRAPEQNPHGKGRAVRVLAFAVRPWRTAKAAFPLVICDVAFFNTTVMW